MTTYTLTDFAIDLLQAFGIIAGACLLVIGVMAIAAYRFAALIPDEK